jgi:hypothetical protein
MNHIFLTFFAELLSNIADTKFLAINPNFRALQLL